LNPEPLNLGLKKWFQEDLGSQLQRQPFFSAGNVRRILVDNPTQLVKKSLMHSDCTTYMAMSKSGWRLAGTTFSMVPQWRASLDWRFQRR